MSKGAQLLRKNLAIESEVRKQYIRYTINDGRLTIKLTRGSETLTRDEVDDLINELEEIREVWLQ